MRRLLLMACSQRKRSDPGLLRAIERYDGPPYRVVRRYLLTPHSDDLIVYILSAEYGLISANHRISYYDRRMTAERALELRQDVAQCIGNLHMGEQFQAAFISVGNDYRNALGDGSGIMNLARHVTWGSGGQGRRLADLQKWLYNGVAVPSTVQPRPRQSHNIILRGQKINVTKDAALAMAQQAIAQSNPSAIRLQSWYVPVDEHRIAVKWLLSALTGIPVSGFGTSEALRVLRQLGIETRQA